MRSRTASAFAESPSVRMRVQCSLLRPPASFASSSLGMPVKRCLFEPSVLFSSLLALKVAHDSTFSTIPDFATAGTHQGQQQLCARGQSLKEKSPFQPLSD